MLIKLTLGRRVGLASVAGSAIFTSYDILSGAANAVLVEPPSVAVRVGAAEGLEGGGGAPGPLRAGVGVRVGAKVPWNREKLSSARNCSRRNITGCPIWS